MPEFPPKPKKGARHKYLPFLSRVLVLRDRSKNETGATVAIALIVALAVIAGTAIVAQRSFDGFLGSVFQGRAKDARLTAEAGTAFIISEWNRPANRRLYTGLPMGSWSTAKNRCTAPSPDFNIDSAANPTAAAISFANGNEVTLPGGGTDISRRFVLISAAFTPGSAAGRGTKFTVTGNPVASSPPDAYPAISETSSRGFVELVVEGRIYRAGSQTPVAASRITREFVVEPKCCNRSFGGAIINTPDLGNDFRSCPGKSDLPIGDLPIVTGIGGGKGLIGGGTAALLITDETGRKLDSITCIRPPVSTDTTCDARTNDLTTKDGDIDYVIKPISLPNPPSIADARSSFCGDISPCTILNGTGLNISSATTIDSDDPDNANCHRGSYPPDSKEAYHCIVSAIDLDGRNDVLTIDTTDRPVYLYLQQSDADIALKGNGNNVGSIVHQNSGSPASLPLTDRLQIRGIPVPSNSACTSSQDFDLGGNSSSGIFIWAPCAKTTMTGTTNFGGILWTNDLRITGTSTLTLSIPSSPGTCVPGSSAVPCRALEDIGKLDQDSKPIDWAARSMNFTRFF